MRVVFCPACGQALPADARFCPSCAAPLAQRKAPGEERKVATVLFADLVGSTALGGSQDPERTRALMDRFYDAMATEITNAGGTVEKFIGDAVMAAFGAPTALEDHAERALHAALAMQRRLTDHFGETLALRIGVNTGEVVVGRAREASSFVTGDAVNVAARLEQAAEPGEILVGERTWAIVRGAFEFEEPTSVPAKGKPDGVVARRLLRALSLMRPRGLGGIVAAFVGRSAELDALVAAYTRAYEEQRPALVTIVGDAGIGKTALIRALWERLGSESPEPLRRVGRCIPYGEGLTYLPLGEIVREHFGLLESDPAGEVRRRLGDREMLGLTLGLEAPADLHPLAARDRLRQAWVAFVEELVAEQPTVVLVEDLHWADDALLDLLEAALHDVRGPLLLLGTARPEFLHVRPAWGSLSRAVETLWLEPLSELDTTTMVNELIPGGVSEQVREVVVERGEGNPFFVEELVRTLVDQGVLQRHESGWVQRAPDVSFSVPDTVVAVLAARIDLLEPAEKAALQAGSVIGRSFWSGPVYELLDGAEPDLRLLEERGFIRHRASSAFAGEREFVVTHALTREVAYGSLTRAQRARLHARFAGWLERAGEGRDEHAALLAHHYAEAVEPHAADLAWSDQPDELERLRRQAVTWLRHAATLAIGRYEMSDADTLLRRAAELETDRAAEIEIWEQISHANALYFDGPAFAEAMQRAIALAGDGAPAADLYAELVFQTLVRSGMWRAIPDPTHIQDWIERTLETAAPTSAARAKALVARCYAAYDKPAELAHEAREIAEARDDAVLRSYCYDALALERFATGDYDAAADWNQRRLALAEELHDPDGEADIYANAIAPVVARGSFDEALAYAISHDTLTSGLSPHHRLHGVSALLELEEMLGRWEAAIALQPRVEESVAANADTPCVRNQRSLLVCALAQLYAGDRSEGLRLEQAAEAHSMTGYGTVLDTPRLLLALERGDLDAVAALIGEPGVRRTNWFYLSSMAAHLDGLAALGRRERVEAEATPHLRPGTYLEPFALRAVGQVADDAAALARAAEAFEGLGLAWHAGRTRRLAASQSTQ